MSAPDSARWLDDGFSDMLDNLVRLVLDALPDEDARKRLVKVLRERNRSLPNSQRLPSPRILG